MASKPLSSENLHAPEPAPAPSLRVDTVALALQGRKRTKPYYLMALPVGSKAPDFTLKSMGPNGLEDVSLSANAGAKATVLLFFPFAFTGVCTQEMCDVTAGLGRYEELNASVIAISVDSPFAQDAWAKKEKLTLKIASDLNKEVTKAYDVLFPGLAGIGDTAARSAFVIDKDGVIVYSEQTPSPKELPSFEKIEAALKSLS